MLDLIGAWGDRADPPRSCAKRVLRSWQLMPAEPDAYGSWSVHDWNAPGIYAPLVPINTSDLDAIERMIVANTERVHGEPKTAPGLYVEFNRESRVEFLGDGNNESANEAQYSVRAGFFNPRRRFNHLLFQINSASAPGVVRGYLASLVQAWEPDYLAVTTYELSKAQGRRTPQMDVGWLTFIRDGIAVDTASLDVNITVTEADGGRYLTLSGTPDNPDMDQILSVRRALGYPIE